MHEAGHSCHLFDRGQSFPASEREPNGKGLGGAKKWPATEVWVIFSELFMTGSIILVITARGRALNLGGCYGEFFFFAMA